MVRSMNSRDETAPVQVHLSLPQLLSKAKNSSNFACESSNPKLKMPIPSSI